MERARRRENVMPGAVNGVVADIRFRTLLGEEAWARLPAEIQARFSKCLAPGDVALYRGHVVETVLSQMGRLLSHVSRLIGSPLPTMNGAVGPAVVIVTEDAVLGGQRWLRIYERPGQRPQMIQSAKRFRGETGLEEYVGAGLTMQLTLSVEDGGLVFRSHHYRFNAGPISLTLPTWLSPGAMTIEHRQLADGSFTFRLRLEHKVFGCLLHQLAVFRDVPDSEGVSWLAPADRA